MAVMEQISTPAPGGEDQRRCYGVLGTEVCFDYYCLPLTAERAKALHEEFGLPL